MNETRQHDPNERILKSYSDTERERKIELTMDKSGRSYSVWLQKNYTWALIGSYDDDEGDIANMAFLKEVVQHMTMFL